MLKRFLFFTLISSVLLALSMPAEVIAVEKSFQHPVKGAIITSFDRDLHRGIDIKAEIGDEIAASQDGTIHWIGKTPRGETGISIQHEDGVRTTYIPVRAKVKKGESIRQGEVIGYLDKMGEVSSPEPHLHFGVKGFPYKNHDYIDPESILIAPPAGKSREEISQSESATKPVTSTSPRAEVEVPSSNSYKRKVHLKEVNPAIEGVLTKNPNLERARDLKKKRIKRDSILSEQEKEFNRKIHPQINGLTESKELNNKLEVERPLYGAKNSWVDNKVAGYKSIDSNKKSSSGIQTGKRAEVGCNNGASTARSGSNRQHNPVYWLLLGISIILMIGSGQNSQITIKPMHGFKPRWA